MTVSEELEPDEPGPVDAAPEPAPDEPAPEDPAETPRAIPPLREVAEIRKPSTIGGIFFLGVLATALIGIGITATGAFRTGTTWLAASLIAAATARVVLPDDKAGMLRVRRKVLDAAILIGAGIAILFLASSIHERPR